MGLELDLEQRALDEGLADGDGLVLAPSVQSTLCLLCGKWYGWDEVHGRIMGGCGVDQLRGEW